ncbi:simA domain protein [Klebsiella pneumoniae]|uniref:simA domain protein n=1 Tax=Klebsiella pneumoniae TaxID=573 RepID=UPI0025A0067B|nr:simA domain protein [Klebsiella pneumoniae]MDM7191306.1 simA domain protein [Klebsiella pneumoniae]
MKKLVLALCFVAGAANASSSVNQICTDYTKYLGHVYGFDVSEDESMRQLLVSDMKRLKLSEAMVQEELYKVSTNENAKQQYSRLLNPDANSVNRSSFDYMVKACETAPDFAIPSWGVLVASNAIRKEDAGKNGIEAIKNAPGMRQQPSANSADFKGCVAAELQKQKSEHPGLATGVLQSAAEAVCYKRG